MVPEERPPSEKLNIACIGVGLKGFDNARTAGHQNIVALCDVDTKHAAPTFKEFPKAKRYSDYRVMLEKESSRIDAVIVSTPDHHHVPASIMAMRAGKHVYCEKPLGQNIAEVRHVTQVAKETDLATQHGTGAHSGHNYMRVAKMVREGLIGEVKEVHCWCDEAWGNLTRPAKSMPVPSHLNWDLWLGPAPVRPYLDGADLSPLLLGKPESVKRKQLLFWHSGGMAAVRDGKYSLVAYPDFRVPKDKEKLSALFSQIEKIMQETNDPLLVDGKLKTINFSGIPGDQQACKLLMQYHQLDRFQESWIPYIKKGGFRHYQLFDLEEDIAQSRDISKDHPVIVARLKQELLRIHASVMADAPDWQRNDI